MKHAASIRNKEFHFRYPFLAASGLLAPCSKIRLCYREKSGFRRLSCCCNKRTCRAIVSWPKLMELMDQFCGMAMVSKLAHVRWVIGYDEGPGEYLCRNMSGSITPFTGRGKSPLSKVLCQGTTLVVPISPFYLSSRADFSRRGICCSDLFSGLFQACSMQQQAVRA